MYCLRPCGHTRLVCHHVQGGASRPRSSLTALQPRCSALQSTAVSPPPQTQDCNAVTTLKTDRLSRRHVVTTHSRFPFEDRFEFRGRTLNAQELLPLASEFLSEERIARIQQVPNGRAGVLCCFWCGCCVLYLGDFFCIAKCFLFDFKHPLMTHLVCVCVCVSCRWHRSAHFQYYQ